MSLFQDQMREFGKMHPEVVPPKEDPILEALKWYADPKNYQKDGLIKLHGHYESFIPAMADYGSRAREALRQLNK